MSCKGCEVITRLPSEHTTLYLIAPLPHTHDKLRRALAGRVSVHTDGDQAVLGIALGPDAAEEVFACVNRVLSAPELRACRAALVPPGETFGLRHLSSVQTLHRLIARHDSGWLADLLQNGGLYSVFQPIVEAARPSQPFAYECLMRGRLEDGAAVGAGPLLEAARAADLLFHLDREARLTAIRDGARHGIETPLFINFNPTAIYDPQFCLRTTVAAAQRSGMDGERFVFEVIESDSVDDAGHLLQILRFYRDAGFRVALDDLGAGYASLNLLAQLRPDFVKFDRQLIQAVHQDEYQQKVVRKLIEMAQDLGIRTIAEGIEQRQEWEWMRDAGVDYVQGYLFARPACPPPRPVALD